jgi:hypothetical protein
VVVAASGAAIVVALGGVVVVVVVVVVIDLPLRLYGALSVVAFFSAFEKLSERRERTKQKKKSS